MAGSLEPQASITPVGSGRTGERRDSVGGGVRSDDGVGVGALVGKRTHRTPGITTSVNLKNKESSCLVLLFTLSS